VALYLPDYPEDEEYEFHCPNALYYGSFGLAAFLTLLGTVSFVGYCCWKSRAEQRENELRQEMNVFFDNAALELRPEEQSPIILNMPGANIYSNYGATSASAPAIMEEAM